MGEHRSHHVQTVLSEYPLHHQETSDSTIRRSASGSNHRGPGQGMEDQSGETRKAGTEDHPQRVEDPEACARQEARSRVGHQTPDYSMKAAPIQNITVTVPD